MRKIIIGLTIGLIISGCIENQYSIEKDLEQNKNVQVIINDFMNYLRTQYKQGKWIQIKGGEGNQYIAKLRRTAIQKGLKVCINKCPTNVISFETLIERIDGNLLEATLTTPKSTFHRIYSMDSKNRIKSFGNKTIYKTSYKK